MRSRGGLNCHATEFYLCTRIGQGKGTREIRTRSTCRVLSIPRRKPVDWVQNHYMCSKRRLQKTEKAIEKEIKKILKIHIKDCILPSMKVLVDTTQPVKRRLVLSCSGQGLRLPAAKYVVVVSGNRWDQTKVWGKSEGLRRYHRLQHQQHAPTPLPHSIVTEKRTSRSVVIYWN